MTIFERLSLPDLPAALPEGFDPAAYLELNPDVAAAGVPAAAHWLAHGRAEGRVWRADPLPAGFDPAVYLALNPDLRAAGVDGARHYRCHGCHEGRFYRTTDPAGRPRRDPLTVFLHIGKTAGSSLNAALFRTLGPGIRHAEVLSGHPWELDQQLRQSGWISGHLTLDEMLDMLAGQSRRSLRLFTLLRRPIDQIASNVNWHLVLHRRAPASMASLPKMNRAAADALAAADLTDPAALIGLLDRFASVFLNAQSRALFGARCEAMTAAEMRSALRLFEDIRLQDEIGTLAARMTGHPGVEVPRENVSPYHFDKTVFRHPEVQAFIERANAADARLVTLVRERAAAAMPAMEG